MATRSPQTKTETAPKAKKATKATAKKAATAKSAPKSAAKSASKTAGRKTATPEVVVTQTHDEIARRAYQIWLAKGKPIGRDHENWSEAERELSRTASA